MTISSLAFPGEDDEGNGVSRLPDVLQKFDPVHARDLVIGDDGIIVVIPEQAECFLCGDCRIDAEFPVPFQKQSGEIEQGGFVVYVEDTDHGRYTLDRKGLSCTLLNSFLFREEGGHFSPNRDGPVPGMHTGNVRSGLMVQIVHSSGRH